MLEPGESEDIDEHLSVDRLSDTSALWRLNHRYEIGDTERIHHSRLSREHIKHLAEAAGFEVTE